MALQLSCHFYWGKKIQLLINWLGENLGYYLKNPKSGEFITLLQMVSGSILINNKLSGLFSLDLKRGWQPECIRMTRSLRVLSPWALTCCHLHCGYPQRSPHFPWASSVIIWVILLVTNHWVFVEPVPCLRHAAISMADDTDRKLAAFDYLWSSFASRGDTRAALS